MYSQPAKIPAEAGQGVLSDNLLPAKTCQRQQIEVINNAYRT